VKPAGEAIEPRRKMPLTQPDEPGKKENIPVTAGGRDHTFRRLEGIDSSSGGSGDRLAAWIA